MSEDYNMSQEGYRESRGITPLILKLHAFFVALTPMRVW
jgi:hypothetical protein